MVFRISSLADSANIKAVADYQTINQGFLVASRERLGPTTCLEVEGDDLHHHPFLRVSCTVADSDLRQAYAIVVDELLKAGYNANDCAVVFETN